LESLMHVRDWFIDGLTESRENKGKNREILGKVLNDVAGGRDFLSILPPDWTERDRLIGRSGPHGTGKGLNCRNLRHLNLMKSSCPIATTASLLGG